MTSIVIKPLDSSSGLDIEVSGMKKPQLQISLYALEEWDFNDKLFGRVLREEPGILGLNVFVFAITIQKYAKEVQFIYTPGEDEESLPNWVVTFGNGKTTSFSGSVAIIDGASIPDFDDIESFTDPKYIQTSFTIVVE